MDLLKLGIIFISMLYVYLLDAQKLQPTDAFKKSQDSPKSGVQSINLPPLCKYKKAADIKRVCLNGRCQPVKFTKLVLECNNARRWNAKTFYQIILNLRDFVKKWNITARQQYMAIILMNWY